MLDGLLSAYWKWLLPAPILSLLETWSHSQYLSKFSEAKVLTLTSDAELSFVLSSGYSSSEHPMCVAFVLFCWPRYGIHLSVDIHKTPFSQNICVFVKLNQRLLLLLGEGDWQEGFPLLECKQLQTVHWVYDFRCPGAIPTPEMFHQLLHHTELPATILMVLISSCFSFLTWVSESRAWGQFLCSLVKEWNPRNEGKWGREGGRVNERH